MSGTAFTFAELRDRFWQRVDKTGDCWIWTGAKFTNGYGCVSVWRKVKKAHRVAWEWEHGPIPGDLTIDHLCNVRLCVNTAHMEVVTRGENSRRGSLRRYRASAGKCRRGHPRNPGERCRECANARESVRRAKAGKFYSPAAQHERERIGRILTAYAEHGYASLADAVADIWPEVAA